MQISGYPATLRPTHLRERLFGPTTFGDVEGDPSDCNNIHIWITQWKLDSLEIVTPFGGIRPLFFYQWGLRLDDPPVVFSELAGLPPPENSRSCRARGLFSWFSRKTP